MSPLRKEKIAFFSFKKTKLGHVKWEYPHLLLIDIWEGLRFENVEGVLVVGEGAGIPSDHCWATFEQGTRPKNPHKGPCDELATYPGLDLPSPTCAPSPWCEYEKYSIKRRLLHVHAGLNVNISHGVTSGISSHIPNLQVCLLFIWRTPCQRWSASFAFKAIKHHFNPKLDKLMLKLLLMAKTAVSYMGEWDWTRRDNIFQLWGSCSRCRNEGKCCCGTCPTACKMGWKIQHLHL